jgi:cell division protein FtsQ
VRQATFATRVIERVPNEEMGPEIALGADRIGTGDSHGLARGVTKNSYTTRTTLWDDESVDGPATPQTRGAWRAPSAVLAGERGRRAAAPVRPVEDEEEIEAAPRVPRRTRFAAAKRPWWRPVSTFGQVLLGAAVLISLGAVLAAGIVVRGFLVHDPHFRIPGSASIQSTGLSEVNRADVLPVFGDDIGRNIFYVPLKERRKELEAIPWVQQATVMRYLPNRLAVSIVERTPVAFVRVGSQIELADAEGVLLTMPPAMMAQHHYSFPVITGIEAKDSSASRKARMAAYQRFLSELDKSGQHLTAQVSEIDLSDPEDLRATMPEQGSDILAHFGDDHFLERWQMYKAHIGEWRSRYPRLIGVDLRYNGEIPLEMAQEQGTEKQGIGKQAAAAPAPSHEAEKKAAPVVSVKKKGKSAAHAVAKKKPKAKAQG